MQAIEVSRFAVEIRGLDRLRPLELLGKGLGMFRGRVATRPDERAVSQAALQEALERLQALEGEKGSIVRGWRPQTGPAQ